MGAVQIFTSKSPTDFAVERQPAGDTLERDDAE